MANFIIGLAIFIFGYIMGWTKNIYKEIKK